MMKKQKKYNRGAKTALCKDSGKNVGSVSQLQIGCLHKKVELYRGIDTIFIRKSLNASSLHFETEPSLNEDTFGPVYVCRRSCSSAAGSVVGAWQVKFWQTYANAFPSGLFRDMARAAGFTDCQNS